MNMVVYLAMIVQIVVRASGAARYEHKDSLGKPLENGHGEGKPRVRAPHNYQCD